MLSVLLCFEKLFCIAGVLVLSSVSKHVFLFQQKVGQIYVFCFKLWMMPLPCIYGTELVFRFQGLCYFTGTNFGA